MKVCKKVVDVENGAVSFTFADGDTTVIRVDDYEADMQRRFMLHGISQKHGDAFANSVSVDEAKEKFHTMLEQTLGGAWSTGKVNTTAILVEALIRVTGKTLEACRDVYAGLDDKAKRDMMKHPAIIKAVAEINLERAQKAAEAVKDVEGDDLSTLFE